MAPKPAKSEYIETVIPLLIRPPFPPTDPPIPGRRQQSLPPRPHPWHTTHHPRRSHRPARRDMPARRLRARLFLPPLHRLHNLHVESAIDGREQRRAKGGHLGGKIHAARIWKRPATESAHWPDRTRSSTSDFDADYILYSCHSPCASSTNRILFLLFPKHLPPAQDWR